MKRINRALCLPFIITCLTSILFIYHLSCISDSFETRSSVIILVILAFVTILAGIFTDSTYFIRERINKRGKK